MDGDFEDNSHDHFPDAGDPIWNHTGAQAKKTEEEEDEDEEAYDWRQSVAEGLSVAWRRIDAHHLHRPPKTRVTLRVDADVLKWFRQRGTGYQTFMNAALRAFMAASRNVNHGISELD